MNLPSIFRRRTDGRAEPEQSATYAEQMERNLKARKAERPILDQIQQDRTSARWKERGVQCRMMFGGER